MRTCDDGLTSAGAHVFHCACQDRGLSALKDKCGWSVCCAYFLTFIDIIDYKEDTHNSELCLTVMPGAREQQDQGDKKHKVRTAVNMHARNVTEGRQKCTDQAQR